MIAGIDGCPEGWFVVLVKDQTYTATVIQDIEEIQSLNLKRAYVDMPMGLSDAHCQRTIEQPMRKLLKKRHSTVFTPPVRAAIYLDDYQEALAVNRKITAAHDPGLARGISKQAFNIRGKICQVDQLLQANKSMRTVFYESHPEICFSMLNAGEPLSTKKNRVAGRIERLNLIQPYLPKGIRAQQLFENWRSDFSQKEVRSDDIVDALVLALLCAQLKHSKPPQLQDDTKEDSLGIPIRIAY